MELSVSSLGRDCFGGLNCPFDLELEVNGSLAWMLRGYCRPAVVPMADPPHDWDFGGGACNNET